jgi:hypothetical protein
MYVNHISATSKIEWLDGKLLSGGYDENWNPIQTTQRLMPITSEVRITQAITPQIMSFVSYQNRAFWDKGAEQMLLNSEFVRAQLKYNFTYDLSLGSFAEIGAKFSPELEKSRGEDEILKHKSSVIFAKGEFQTLKGLYLGGGYSQMPDRLNRYEGIVRAFITPVNEIFVNYIYTDDVEFDARTSYAGAGVRMMF